MKGKGSEQFFSNVLLFEISTGRGRKFVLMEDKRDKVAIRR
jgi:hypothetical protein